MQVFHSTGNEPLKQATEPVKNGEQHLPNLDVLDND